jgi:hypothetical protein
MYIASLTAVLVGPIFLLESIRPALVPLPLLGDAAVALLLTIAAATATTLLDYVCPCH